MMMPAPLPVTRLTWHQLWLPIAVLALATIIDGTALLTVLGIKNVSAGILAGPLGIKLAVGLICFAGGFWWLAKDWRPGGAKPTDYIIPWLMVAVVVIYALLQPLGEKGGTHAAHIFAMAVPFMVGLTLLTRLFAPTDLCSASNAIGFTAGGVAVLLYALHCPLTDVPTILLTYAMAIAASALTSRIFLCHFIKW